MTTPFPLLCLIVLFVFTETSSSRSFLLQHDGDGACGGLLPLRVTGSNFSVVDADFVDHTSFCTPSSTTSFGRSGQDGASATVDASLLCLRPTLMKALGACLGLLPAAVSTGISSDSQKPCAIVIVGGLARGSIYRFPSPISIRWWRETTISWRIKPGASHVPFGCEIRRLTPQERLVDGKLGVSFTRPSQRFSSCSPTNWKESKYMWGAWRCTRAGVAVTSCRLLRDKLRWIATLPWAFACS